MVIWIIGIYAAGVVAYWLSGGWFRYLILGLSWIITPIFFLFTSFAMSVTTEAGLGIGALYIFIAPISLFCFGQVCASVAHIIQKSDTNKLIQTTGMSLVLVVPPLMAFWLILVKPKVKMQAQRDHLAQMKLSGVFEFYFAGKKFEFPCHDALFSFYGHSRHGGEDICRLKNTVNSERQMRTRLYINHRDSGHYYFCDKNGTPERKESAYCQFKRPSKRTTFSLSSDWELGRQLKHYNESSVEPIEMIGGLKLLKKTVKTYDASDYKNQTLDKKKKIRRPSTRLKFTKEWNVLDAEIKHLAFMFCDEGGHYDLQARPYNCRGHIQITEKVWVDINFEAEKAALEIELNNERDRVWGYWIYLNESYGNSNW